MAEKRKSRDGHARKPAKDKPATVEPTNGETPPAPPREYDPKPIVERLDVWSLNGKDRYFLKDEEAQRVLSVNEKDVKRKLRLAGIGPWPALSSRCPFSLVVFDLFTSGSEGSEGE